MFKIKPIYVIIGLYWFFMRGKLGIRTFDTVDFYSILILGLWFVGEQSFVLYKYKTAQFVADNIHFSCYTQPRKVGLWNIYRGGDIEFLGIRGRDATIVVPRKLCYKLGENNICMARVERVEYNALPPEVRNVITSDGYTTETCYLGYLPIQTELEDPRILFDVIKERDNNALIASKDDIIQGKYTQVEEHVGHAGRLTDRLKRGWLQKVMDKVGGKDDVDKE